MSDKLSFSAQDVLAIEKAVLSFAYRDTNQWEKLRALFTATATIRLSWYDGPIDGFIARSAAGASAGAPPSKHFIYPPRIEIAGDRATAETDIAITVRTPTPSGECDLTSWARFYDLFVRESGEWLIERRSAIYERDRLDRVGMDAGSGTVPDLSIYPAAYKHLAYVLSLVGRSLEANIPVSGSKEEAEIFEFGQKWLSMAESKQYSVA